MQYHPAGVDISDITVCKELFLAELTLGIYEGDVRLQKKIWPDIEWMKSTILMRFFNHKNIKVKR